MLTVQLEHSGFGHLSQEIGTANAGGPAPGTDGFGHELNALVDQVGVVGVLCHQQRVLDVVADQIPIFFHSLCRTRFGSLRFRRLSCRFPERNRIGT